METASLILSIISLGIDIKTIISDHIMSNKTLDDLLNKAIQKARKDANIDSQYLPGKPLNEKTLNKVLLDLVIKHVNDESIDIPHWLLENEFYKFYDSLMQNVDFLNFLHQELESHQHLLQNEKLDEANSILKEIRNQIELLSQQQFLQNEKLDSIDETTKEIKNQIRNQIESLSEQQLIENEKLDTIDETTKEIKNQIRNQIEVINNTYNGTKEDDWLQPYDPNDDVLISYYIDGRWVGKIENKLSNKKVCLIKASEGRGKTCLSRIIAKKYSEKGYEVWFGNITKLNASGESLKQWCKKKNTNCLVILENLHSCKTNRELECLVKSIELMKKPQWPNNGNNKLLFLLNTRPTLEDFDTLMLKLGKGVIEELEPDIEYCKGVARLSKRPIDDKVLDSFLKSKRFGFSRGNANLRLLGIILEIWETDDDLSSIQNVNEKKIILRFKTRYELEQLKEMEEDCLMFLSSIFQFDIPLSRWLLKSEEIDFLKRLCNYKHLVIYKDYKFYLPHSVDASYLSKAIGGRQCIEQTQEKILDFVARILNYKTPRDFEGDFKLLISGLKEKNTEFEEAIKALTQWGLAEQIIQNINPPFIITAFDTRFTKAKEVETIYLQNKELLREIILDLPPFIQNALANIFNKYLELEKVFVNDIFVNLKELNDYIDKYHPSGWKWRDIWRELCEKEDFRKTIEERVPVGGFPNPNQPNQYEYYFNSKVKKEGAYIIKNVSYTSYVNGLKKPEFENHVYKLYKKGICFESLNWRRLCGYLGKMADCVDENNRSYFKAVAQNMVEMVLDKNKEFLEQPGALGYATSEQLSSFLYHLKRIDETIYSETVSDVEVVEEVKARYVENFGLDELLLFSHFYGTKKFDYKVHELAEKAESNIESTNEYDFSITLASINNNNQSLYGELVGNTIIIKIVKKRLENLTSISSEGLYLFSHFYSQDWCKTKMNELIDNADEEQQKVIKEWHDEVVENLTNAGKTLENKGTLLDYIRNKFYSQQQNN